MKVEVIIKSIHNNLIIAMISNSINLGWSRPPGFPQPAEAETAIGPIRQKPSAGNLFPSAATP